MVRQFWHLPVAGVLLKDLARTATTAAKVDIGYACSILRTLRITPV